MKDKITIRDFTMEYVKERAEEEITPATLKEIISQKEKILKKCADDKLLSHFKDDVRIFLKIVEDYEKGEYSSIPFSALSVMAYTLKYILEENDIIHDSIPCHGQLDDAIIMLYAVQITEEEVRKFRKHMQ